MLLLSKWNSLFASFPAESIIYDRHQEYHEVINASKDTGNSTVFIKFMLSALNTSLIEVVCASDGKIDKVILRWNRTYEYLKTHDYIMNADVRELCRVSTATESRIPEGLVTKDKLDKYRENAH